MTDAIVVTGAGVVAPGPAPGGILPDAAVGALAEPVRARAARAERIVHLALGAGGAALAAAGLAATDGPPRPRVGVILGTAFGCFLTNAAHQRRVREAGAPAASPRLFAATVSNAAAGELGIAFRLGGPAVTLTAGGASGLVALGHAADLLAGGHADALLAGGVDALGDALVRWLDDGGLSVGRPPAEAAALVVLEPRAKARARGAAVLGTIAGCAAGFEPAPEDGGDGLTAAIRAALADAAVAPDALGVVVSAAPPALAGLEARALAAALGGARPPRVAPKDASGETFGAAGVLGVLAALGEAPPGTTALVLDVCPSGHVAALVATR